MRSVLLLALLSVPIFGTSVSGVVKDPSGAAIAQAVVGLGSAVVTTDAQGRFEFPDIPSGEYRLTVTRDGFEPFSRNVTAGPSRTITLQVAAVKASVLVSGGRSALRNSDPNYLALRGGSLRGVYHVKDLVLVRDAGTFTFRSGSFSFLPPVLGRVTGGVFIGDGNFQLKPASAIAANHLKQISATGSVDEDFGSLVMYFTDATFQEITAHAEVMDESPKAHQDVLRELQETLRRRSDMPQTFLARLTDADDVPNLEAEILAELYNQAEGSFRAFIHGRRLSGLRFLLNPLGAVPQLPAPEEVALLDFDPSSRADGIWYLSHTIAELRSGSASSMEEKRLLAPEHYRIETAIDRNLHLSVACGLRLSPVRDGVRAVKFDLLPDMQVSRITLDGREIPFLQESRKQDGSFYVVLPQALVKGRAYEVEFEYEGGNFIIDEGSKLFVILPTLAWYPRVGGVSRATYDMTFRVPGGMTVIATGDRIKSAMEGGRGVSQWVSKVTLPIAGFNYGSFYSGKKWTDGSNGFRLEAWLGAGQGRLIPDATAGLKYAENAVRVFRHWYGDPPYGHLAISEANYQGSLPELLFASALSMTDAASRYGTVAGNAPTGPVPETGALSRYDTTSSLTVAVPQPPEAPKPISLATSVSTRAIPRVEGAMFDESLAREVSRQWWGALMNPASFHEDWLIRGLMDFSGSLYDMAAESETNDFREHWRRAREVLLAKTYWGIRRADAAPLWLGSMAEPLLTQRVVSFPPRPFIAPNPVLSLMKGGYVIHMLRALMFDRTRGDQDFIAMMHDFTSTFAHRSVSTEGFKSVVEKHMKPEMDLDGNKRMDWFFNEWVYGTEMPSYSLEYSLTKDGNGKAVLRGKLTQSGVSERFRMRVPIYVQAGAKTVAIGAFSLAGNQTREFRAELPEEPKNVLLNVNYDVLCAEAEVRQVR